MKNAAAALWLGWGDPIAFMGLTDEERAIADAVLKEAARLRQEEQTALAKALGSAVGNVLAKAFGT